MSLFCSTGPGRQAPSQRFGGHEKGGGGEMEVRETRRWVWVEGFKNEKARSRERARHEVDGGLLSK